MRAVAVEMMSRRQIRETIILYKNELFVHVELVREIHTRALL